MSPRFVLDPDELLDVTVPLSSSTPCWPGDQPFERKVTVDGGFVTSKLIMSSHSGTHLDAPAHLDDVFPGVSDVSPRQLVLPAILVEHPDSREPGIPEDLEGKALLFKTGGRKVFLTGKRAREIAEKGAYLVGTDAMTVDPPGSSNAHTALLGASVCILENLSLEKVEPGEYLLLCFPLRITGGDGAPARVFLHPLVEFRDSSRQKPGSSPR